MLARASHASIENNNTDPVSHQEGLVSVMPAPLMPTESLAMEHACQLLSWPSPVSNYYYMCAGAAGCSQVLWTSSLSQI